MLCQRMEPNFFYRFTFVSLPQIPINMKILVVGSGKLAKSILNANISTPHAEVIPWTGTGSAINEKSIVVHAGSGRELNECLEFCSKTKSTFIELSTGMNTESFQPDFPLIICPNTSLLVLKTLHVFKENSKHFEGFDISITESHQSAKTTEPGTAYDFARSLNFPVEKIKSVRDKVVQNAEIGIPEEYLDKHAYHDIRIKDGNDEITIQTKVLGHESYAKGVKAISEAVMKFPLENKKYMVWDLIREGKL